MSQGESMKTSETLSDTERDDMDTSGDTIQNTGNKKKEDKEEISDNMKKIEKEFSELKDSLFSNSIKWLETDRQRIQSGSHIKFIEGAGDLETARDEKLWRIEQWRKYRLENIEKMFLAEKQQAYDEYEAEKEKLQEKLLHNVQNKLSQLEEEKLTLSSPDGKLTTRQLRKRGKEKEPKEVQMRKLNPSHINYTLQDADISEDLNLISKHHPANPNFDRTKWLSYLEM